MTRSRQVLSIWRGLIETRPSMASISRRIAERNGLTVEDLLSDSRLPEIVEPRQASMRACLAAGYSVSAVGRFHQRTQSTVRYAVRKVADRQDVLPA